MAKRTIIPQTAAALSSARTYTITDQLGVVTTVTYSRNGGPNISFSGGPLHLDGMKDLDHLLQQLIQGVVP